MARNLLTATFDAATELKDAGALTATGVGQVGAVNRVVNLGNAFAQMTWIVDVDAIDITTGDEGYTVVLQGSTSPTFASDVHNISTLRVGDSTTTGESADAGVNRYARSVVNSKDGNTPLPYVRVNTTIVGTTPSINFRSWLTKSPL